MTTSIWINALKKILVVLLWLGLWQLAAVLVGDGLLLPTPIDVTATLLHLAGEGKFWLSIAVSLARVAAGFAAGVLSGVLLGVLTTRFRFADELLSPAVGVIKSVPVASFIMLVILIFDRNILPVFTCFIMVLPVVWSNTCLGIKSVSKKQLEWAKAYRLPHGKVLLKLYIPAVMPYVAAASVTAMGLAWKAGIAAEVLCQPAVAIGTGIYESKLYLETNELFAWTAVVAVMSFIIEKLLQRALRQLKGDAVNEA